MKTLNITNQTIINCEEEIENLTEDFQMKLEQLKEKIRIEKVNCAHETITLPSHGYTIKQCTKCGMSGYE